MPIILGLKKNVQIARREYRGQRTTDAIAKFVQEQLQDPVQTLENMAELAAKVRLGCNDYLTTNGCSLMQVWLISIVTLVYYGMRA